MKKLRRNDEVVVLSGKDRGKTGKVLKINWTKGKVFVQGVNMLRKTMKPSQENPNGGIVDMEGAMHISNVSLVSPKTNKATRVRIEKKDKKNVRVAVKCGSSIK